MKTDQSFPAKRKLYTTARIVDSEHYVRLDRFCPASERYRYADFWQVTDATGKQFHVFERELTDLVI